MRVVTCHRGELAVAEVPDPVPARGQVLIEVTRCGICGSDLHARTHSDLTADGAAEIGYDAFMRAEQTVVMGHEFAGRVLGYGPGCRESWPIGTRVVSLPVLRHDDGAHLTGLSVRAPGGYAEKMLVSEVMTMPIPDGVSDDHAATTEPLAVAYHAVRRSEVRKKDVAIVVGCGPIGLAVILMLKAAGVRTVVASDLSAARRSLATRCGADIVVDPRVHAPWTAYGERKGHLRTAPSLIELGMDTMKVLRRVPGLPWWRVMRAAEKVGATPRGPVVFECVGVLGMIEDVITHAPLLSRVVVVGVCMEPDTFRPSMAINKEIDLRFVFAYGPDEFYETLHMIADGTIDPSPLLTGTVGLDGVAAAFEALGDPERHAKILIDPASDVSVP
ncbi:alcohol dehydrogenase catalytic domain-containing protein [Mumia zhuanghuii]|uniref:Zinc-binding dehydrogenase n=2 Tax=Mumia TaxID=1546255 RepID=A0ABW1QGG6_9ACTN|nr:MULTISPECIES: zinc-binding dehydrogenase [Mumia]KAA1422687.1 alcohol dehydrogenase catalytic domain-containing protein [Mumia zhuanghuii]